jgi:type I restriction enzyme M protein
MARNKSSKTESTANLGFEQKLWLAADKLRNNMDAAEYSRAEQDRLPKATRKADVEASVNHVVIGLIFLKYISDTFDEHHAKLITGQGDFVGTNPEDKDEPSGTRQPAAGSPKGERGSAKQYRVANVFWVPLAARWPQFQSCAKLPSIGKDVDDAMVALERDNHRLKGALNKNYGCGDIGSYGQDSNPTTRRLAIMNLALRGIEANFGPETSSANLSGIDGNLDPEKARKTLNS